MNIELCPVCGCERCTTFLARHQVPVHQNLVLTSQSDASAATRGDLILAVCEACGFVFNRAFDMALLSYGDGYDNTQSHSHYFDAYLNDLVKDLVETKGVRNARIVEVGCGKGHFLRKLVEFPESGNVGFGFDPSYIGPDVALDGKLEFQRKYYDASCTDVGADVVVCRHVIEHVSAPLDLLRAVRAALNDAPGARVFFETPCVGWILENQVFWDFFYEHCSLFSADTLALAFERAGFRVDRVAHIFGGQYLWLEASVATPAGRERRSSASQMSRAALACGVAEARLRESWVARLAQLGQGGRVALWGAGAKGATFANLVDADCQLIDCVVDVNPAKQGGYIPGTGHAIVGPAELKARGVNVAILMNPNYRLENLALLKDFGLDSIVLIGVDDV
ncbi:MAG TPA: class I SAM-dependent methyltransferase [Chitinolyticbacter sp.]|nr:class I SAM-dependent methyltransferase [Chitinolyticbacter sp.]